VKRSYLPSVGEYLDTKVVLLMGPRQCGKTTLSKMLTNDFEYLNFDSETHRKVIRERSWDRGRQLLIFDELHKMRNWKRWLKGLYDTEGLKPQIIVTGSAKLDTFKRVGDSMAGRYFQYRIHPLDVRELSQVSPEISLDEQIERLLAYSGFPEPFLKNQTRFYNLWKKTHLDIILKQDLLFQENVRDLRSIEILIELLQERVGSPVSYSSLAEDLQCSDKTVKRWLSILEAMYIVFKITPFHKNIARSVLKQPKYYFYDLARVKSGEGAKIENLVAHSLLKECHFRQDVLGEDWNLSYLAKKGGKEIDFAILRDGKINFAVEVKSSDFSASASFQEFQRDLPRAVGKIQLVKDLQREKTYPSGVEIRELGKWLSSW